MNVKTLVQSTPNPNSKKFITNQVVKTNGKSIFTSPKEAESVPLARELFSVQGVSEIYFFDNFITVTKEDQAPDWDTLIPQLKSLIITHMPIHDPNFSEQRKSKTKNSPQLSPELQKIEEILNRTIRPGLQSDGGDLDIISLEDNVLTISYQGACGTCPSAISGTLQAIESILQNEYDPQIRVYAL